MDGCMGQMKTEARVQPLVGRVLNTNFPITPATPPLTLSLQMADEARRWCHLPCFRRFCFRTTYGTADDDGDDHDVDGNANEAADSTSSATSTAKLSPLEYKWLLYQVRQNQIDFPPQQQREQPRGPPRRNARLWREKEGGSKEAALGWLVFNFQQRHQRCHVCEGASCSP